MGTLRAIVIGAGFAGEGHTAALRYMGVDVLALCARQPKLVGAMASRLGIPIASNDWRATLEETRPDIVALGTPASLRREVIEAAVAQGCHLYCDKPLATTAPEAAALYHLVEAAGVKHAYAATHCYDPSVAWLAELVRDEAVGRLQEVSFTLRSALSAPLPWSWFLMRELGGGILNNAFVHSLSILERVLGSPLVRVMGEAHNIIERAPVIPGIHDFRDWVLKGRSLTPETLAGLEWRACDAEGSYSALMRFVTPGGEIPVTIGCGQGIATAAEAAGMRLYGERGTLIARGEVAFSVSRVTAREAPETPMPVPERLLADLPQTGGYCEDRWAALAREFVADVRGDAHRPYLTFRDGWRYQEAIDAIRSGQGWHELPVR